MTGTTGNRSTCFASLARRPTTSGAFLPNAVLPRAKSFKRGAFQRYGKSLTLILSKALSSDKRPNSTNELSRRWVARAGGFRRLQAAYFGRIATRRATDDSRFRATSCRNASEIAGAISSVFIREDGIAQKSSRPDALRPSAT